MRTLFGIAAVAAVTLLAVRITTAGFYDSAVVWNETNLSSTLHVCFENLYATEAEWIREDVESTWGADSAWEFVWDTDAPCAQQTTTNIRVNLIYNDNANCLPTNCGTAQSGFGASINGVVDGVNICLCSSVPDTTRRGYFAYAGTHEFGHALALHHEQERLDTPPGCNDDGARTGTGSSLVPVGPYDPQSVMNYCAVNGHGGLLTAEDTYTIGKIYGASFPYSVTSQRATDIDVIARREASTNEGVSVRTFTSGAWGSWVDLNMATVPASAPASVAPDSTHLDVFVATEAGTIMHATRTGTSGGTWSTWSDLGGTNVGGDVVALSRASNRLTVLARNQDNALAVREWDGTQWLPWVTVAGPISGRPAAVVAQDGSIHVFANWSDHHVRWLSSTATGVWPSSWTDLGPTSILGSPNAVAIKNTTGTRDVYLFVRGTDNHLYYRELTTSWGAYTSLGTPTGLALSGSPSAVSRDNGYLDVFVRASSGQIWETWFTPTGWSGSWGGQLPSAPASIDASPVAIATSPNDMQFVARDFNTAVGRWGCTTNPITHRTTCSWSVANMPQTWWSDNLVY